MTEVLLKIVNFNYSEMTTTYRQKKIRNSRRIRRMNNILKDSTKRKKKPRPTTVLGIRGCYWMTPMASYGNKPKCLGSGSHLIPNRRFGHMPLKPASSLYSWSYISTFPWVFHCTTNSIVQAQRRGFTHLDFRHIAIIPRQLTSSTKAGSHIELCRVFILTKFSLKFLRFSLLIRVNLLYR